MRLVEVVAVAVGGGGGDGGGGDVGGGGGGIDELITPHHQASLANVPSPRGSFNSCSEVTFNDERQKSTFIEVQAGQSKSSNSRLRKKQGAPAAANSRQAI